MNNQNQNQHLIHETLLNLFGNEKEVSKNFRPSKKAGVSTHELELALAVMLVELASSDQHFDPSEYHTISNGLKRVFGTSVVDVRALINQATVVLGNLRGTASFATLLKENLNGERRQLIMDVIDEVIMADGVLDDFEIYLRHKFSDLLGVKIGENSKLKAN